MFRHGFASPDELGNTASPHRPFVESSAGEVIPLVARTTLEAHAMADCPDCGVTLHGFDTNGDGALVSCCRACGLRLAVPSLNAGNIVYDGGDILVAVGAE